MNIVKVAPCPEWIMHEEQEVFVKLSESVYLHRIDALLRRMEQTQTDFVVIYGDREHFANVEYFTRYDARFEETLFILSKDGCKTIVVGNEGEAYSHFIPYPIRRIVYRHFSLQGQPRGGVQNLRDVYAEAGITGQARVGFVGNKYFEGNFAEDPAHSFDVPAYMITELYRVVPPQNVVNYTREITGLPNGIRMALREPEEVAYFEYQAIKTANVIRRMLKGAKPGMSETEIAKLAECDLLPTQMYPLVNVTPLSMSLSLRSPMPDLLMEEGEVFGLCYSQRGSLCAKVGIAARDEKGIAPRLQGKMQSFYMKHWQAVAHWLEALHAGTTGHQLYRAAMDIIGGKEFGVTLNPGHYIGMDEWTNSASYDGSEVPVISGAVLQTDIIASSPDQPMVSICEDTVIVADEAFRKRIADEYPELYARIEKRRATLRETLGIQVHDDVLPLSGLVGVMFPYMLDLTRIYSLEK